MSIPKILLPYNFSALDQKAVSFAIQMFKPMEGADITVFHAYTPLPGIEIKTGMVTEKMKGSLRHLSQQLIEQENILKTVALNLSQSGFPNRAHALFKPRKKDIANEIIETARDMQFEFIILNRKHERITRFFSSSVSQKIITTLTNTNICIVT
jgi:nucleotide-binding universal stress UspA family protein